MSGIRPLNKDIVDRIQSSISLPDLLAVVLELLHNALDAESTRVDIAVDFERGDVSIQDDGTGIVPDEFQSSGNLGKPFHSSKCQTGTTHGWRGAFLASLATQSFLIMTSRHVEHHSTNSMTFYRGKTICRRTPIGRDSFPVKLGSHGTRVEVRDLFGDIPVRVKCRPSSATPASDIDKLWSSIIQVVLATLIAWPHQVRVSLTDRCSERGTRFVNMAIPMVLARPDKQDCSKAKLSRAPHLMSVAKIILRSATSSFMPVSARAAGISVSGIISKRAAATKKAQFISCGHRPITRGQDDWKLFDTVNQTFEASGFDSTEADESPRSVDPNPRRSNRSVDRWPVFYFDVQFDGKCSLPSLHASNIDSVRRLMVMAVKEWLRASGFGPAAAGLPEKRSKNVRTRTSTTLNRAVEIGKVQAVSMLSKPAKTTSLSSSMRGKSGHVLPVSERARLAANLSRPGTVAFANWSRIKTASGKDLTDIWSQSFPKRSHGRSGSGLDSGATPEVGLVSRQSTTTTDNAHVGGPLQARQEIDDGEITSSDCTEIEDPTTCKPLKLSKRTGMIYYRPRRSTDVPRVQDQIDPEVEGRKGSRKPTRCGHHDQKSWLDRITETWSNPVFHPPPCADKDHRVPTRAGQSRPPGDGRGHASEIVALHRLSKSSLLNAKVMGQVDNKFILIETTDTSESSQHIRGHSQLVLVDQHAASERVTLEALLQELVDVSRENIPRTQVKTSALHRPILFIISHVEQDLLLARSEHLARWGVLFDSGLPTSDDEAMVRVTHLPPAISERCLLEPRLLIEMIREELHRPLPRIQQAWEVDAAGQVHLQRSFSWLESMHDMPTGLLELLKSRACRSAVMFNDVLSADQCRDLIHELAKCVFPFACVHGRISMVPLVSLEKRESSSHSLSFDKGRSDGLDFVEAAMGTAQNKI